MVNISAKQEITLLRSALAGLIGKDREGQYRPEFVKEMYAQLPRSPQSRFTTPESFLEDVSKT